MHLFIRFFIVTVVTLCFLEMKKVKLLLEKLPDNFEDMVEKVTTVKLWPHFLFFIMFKLLV